MGKGKKKIKREKDLHEPLRARQGELIEDALRGDMTLGQIARKYDTRGDLGADVVADYLRSLGYDKEGNVLDKAKANRKDFLQARRRDASTSGNLEQKTEISEIEQPSPQAGKELHNHGLGNGYDTGSTASVFARSDIGNPYIVQASSYLGETNPDKSINPAGSNDHDDGFDVLKRANSIQRAGRMRRMNGIFNKFGKTDFWKKLNARNVGRAAAYAAVGLGLFYGGLKAYNFISGDEKAPIEKVTDREVSGSGSVASRRASEVSEHRESILAENKFEENKPSFKYVGRAPVPGNPTKTFRFYYAEGVKPLKGGESLVSELELADPSDKSLTYRLEDSFDSASIADLVSGRKSLSDAYIERVNVGKNGKFVAKYNFGDILESENLEEMGFLIGSFNNADEFYRAALETIVQDLGN